MWFSHNLVNNCICSCIDAIYLLYFIFGQVLASIKNKIEQFASIEKDFPALLIQAQKYLLLRVDALDVPLESLNKGNNHSW